MDSLRHDEDPVDSPLKILITGCSSGFGRLTALALARRGHTVFAGMRGAEDKNADAAAELRTWAEAKAADLSVVDLDVTLQDSVALAVDLITAAVGPLDVLVNNAGIAAVGLEETFTPNRMRALFEVNVLGVQRLNRAVLPHMRARGSGLLVHVSSTFARLNHPCMGLYCASKAALEALAEGYHYELAPLGIDSVIVEPGAFPTGMGAKIIEPDDAARASGYGAAAAIPDRLERYFAQILSGADAPDPERVARAIVALIELPPGLRPLRTVIDPQTEATVEAINGAAAVAQGQVLERLGMADLAMAPSAAPRGPDRP
jgi:NAD(P)-dependent dehydrogenase (short-subunit alcohol dehydrogenase family)